MPAFGESAATDEFPISAIANDQFFSTLRAFPPDGFRPGIHLRNALLGKLNLFGKRRIEFTNHIHPILITRGNLIQLCLHPGCETGIYHLGKMFGNDIVH